MRKLLVVASVLVISAVAAAPATAEEGAVERIAEVPTVLAVAFPDNFPVGSLSRAVCSSIQRVTMPDGSAKETQTCVLSDEPVIIAEFQGSAPDQALVYQGGGCQWLSDFAFALNGTDEYAESFRVVVTPAGQVHASSSYPAAPLECG